MAATLLQTSPTLRTQASGATSTLSFSGSLTAGSLVVVCVTNFSGGITSVVGSVNGAYTRAVQFFDGGNNAVELWYRENVSAGAETLTITPSTTSNNYISARAQEWAGMVTSGALDKIGSAGALSVATATATSQADEIAFTAAVADAGSANCTWGLPAGYTAIDAEQDSNNFTGYSWGYKALSAAGVESVTHTAAVVGDSVIATFKVAAAPPPAPSGPVFDSAIFSAPPFDTGATGGGATVTGITLSASTSLTFGGVSAASQATGQTLTATASLISGTASASSSASVSGTTLTATASLIAGAASGTSSASVSGQTLAVSTSLTAGTLSADSSVSGLTLTATASLLAGAATGGSAGTVSGQVLPVSASIIAGSLAADSSVAGVTLTGGTVSLIPGAVAAASSVSGTPFSATAQFFPGTASAGSAGATVTGQDLTTTVFFLAGFADNAALPRFPVRDRARNIVPRKYK